MKKRNYNLKKKKKVVVYRSITVKTEDILIALAIGIKDMISVSAFKLLYKVRWFI